MMRRTFVPRRKAPRHPLRKALAPSLARKVEVRDDDKDLKLFVLSFTAFFICFYTFLL